MAISASDIIRAETVYGYDPADGSIIEVYLYDDDDNIVVNPDGSFTVRNANRVGAAATETYYLPFLKDDGTALEQLAP